MFWKPSIASDLVIFAVNTEGKLHLLLIERGKEPFKGKKALPGGFLDENDADMEACAIRELQEETGLIDVELSPIGLWSKKDRDPRQNRVISAPYLGFLEELPQVVAGSDAAQATWVPVEEVKEDELAFDHFEIFQAGLGALNEMLDDEDDEEDGDVVFGDVEA